MQERLAIVGAGHAAGQAVISLREAGYQGRITLIGEEAYPPYERPPLSKKLLLGEITPDRTFVRPADFYQAEGTEHRTKCRVEGIDRDAGRLLCADGGKIEFDKLILATGGRPRHLPLEGSELDGVFYLRNIQDSLELQSQLREGGNIVVIGGGFIGLEVAGVAQQKGMTVTVVESMPRILGRVTAPMISDYVTAFHEGKGTQILTDCQVKAFRGRDHVEAVVLADREIKAEVVVVGIGILPNVELAQDAGLACDNGILVDEYCRTEDPRILAVGDVTNHPNGLLDRRLRLESVHNAVEQARTAARTIMGDLQAYNEIPWFWSDQHDLRWQIAGISDGHDQTVLRGDPTSGSFALFYLQEGRLIAVDAINRTREYMAGRKIIPKFPVIDVERLADESVDMKSFLKA
jgi:3-phenylpropionate/trans-cinnamate dioxygenase ferredoxin reductase subunit